MKQIKKHEYQKDNQNIQNKNYEKIEDGLACGGYAIKCKDKNGITDFIIWLKNSRDTDHIVHETQHMTHIVLDDRGINWNKENEELFAYYQGFLFREITNKLK